VVGRGDLGQQNNHGIAKVVHLYAVIGHRKANLSNGGERNELRKHVDDVGRSGNTCTAVQFIAEVQVAKKINGRFHSIVTSGAWQEDSADAVACLPVPRALVFSLFSSFCLEASTDFSCKKTVYLIATSGG
jgi:hypothetical protein